MQGLPAPASWDPVYGAPLQPGYAQAAAAASTGARSLGDGEPGPGHGRAPAPPRRARVVRSVKVEAAPDPRLQLLPVRSPLPPHIAHRDGPSGGLGTLGSSGGDHCGGAVAAAPAAALDGSAPDSVEQCQDKRPVLREPDKEKRTTGSVLRTQWGGCAGTLSG